MGAVPMAMRWGPGPVFVYESLVAARRWSYYAARSVFALALAIVWFNFHFPIQGSGDYQSRAQLARLGQQFYYGIAGVQVSLILLAAPAAAGAVCLDRARGTLTHVMVTDLSDVEIVLGKLASRLAPVFALVAAAVPVLALAGLLGFTVRTFDRALGRVDERPIFPGQSPTIRDHEEEGVESPYPARYASSSSPFK